MLLFVNLNANQSIANELGKLSANSLHNLDINKIDLTLKEKQWINSHTVRVGVEEWFPIVFLNKKKEIDGISGDFTKKIIEKTGLKIEIVSEDWDSLLVKFKNKQIDMIPTAYYTKKRAKIGFFSEPYFKVKDAIYMNNSDDIKNLKDLEGKTLAILKDHAIIDKLQKEYPKINLLFTSGLDENINLLLDKKVDAFYEGLMVAQMKLNTELITGIKSVVVKNFTLPQLHFWINKDKDILYSIIQKAIASFTYKDKDEIISKWLLNNNEIHLIDEELIWLEKDIVIRYAYDPNWKPLEWADELKEHKGIISDIIKLIKQKSDINIQPIYSKSWDDVINKVKSHKADMFLTGEISDKEHLNFTNQHILTSPYVFISRVSDDYLDGFDSLKNKKIGVFKNSSIHNILKKTLPNLKLVFFTSDEKALKMIKDEQLDVAILSANLAKYYINMLGYKSTLKIAYKTKYNLELKFALNKTMGEIPLSIINKSIEGISEKEISDIIDKWTTVRIYSKTDWVFLAQVGGAIFLIILFILWNNHKLQITVKEKTKDLQNVLNSMEVTIQERTKDLESTKKEVEQILANILLPVLITSKKRRTILYANRYAEQQYEKTLEDIVGSNIDEIYTMKGQHHHIIDAIKKYGFIENFEEEFKTSTGKTFTALLSVISINYKNEEAYIGMVTDITKQKKMENEVRAIHKQTRDSIEYASLIQGALIPQEGVMKPYFKDHFVTWIPKDTVGGDIWLLDDLRHEDECLLFFIDCTGHGVPGAFVTMIVKAVEREIISIINADKSMDVSPAWVMGYFNKTIKKLLRQETKDSLSNAGFDGGIVYYNRREQIVKFAGAETSLFYMDENNEFITLKGNRYSVGYKKCDADYKYKETIINVKEGMKFYCTTDGYLDQNGGEKGFPFGKKRFLNIIKNNYNEPMEKLQSVLMMEMMKYENMIPDNDRNDDITLIGFEIGDRSTFKENDIEEIVKYEGVMIQNVIASCIDNIEIRISHSGLRGTLSIITIELCQNIMNYAKGIKQKDNEVIIPAGSIKVQSINDDFYEIIATNIVSKKDKEKIEPKLQEIESLDKKSIKKRYRELLRSGENAHKIGAGIGMYEIAKASENIKYEFTEMSEDRYSFTMKSIAVSTKKI